MRQGRLTLVAAVLLCLSIACVAAGTAPTANASANRDSSRGRVLRGAATSFPDYLDPQLSYTAEGWMAMYDTYIPLLTYRHASGQEGSEVIPGLARELPKITDDGKTYTLFLRKGLRYSNGQLVRASDFKFTIERLFRLNSPGSPFYTDIVGAGHFEKTKRGNIRGISTNDRSGRIVIHLVKPRGTFPEELGLLFAAPVPPGTPATNQTSHPPPATGPYLITSSRPGRGWSYTRNPEWKSHNGRLLLQLPSGHVNRIHIAVIPNEYKQVDEVEHGKLDWMLGPVSAVHYSEVKNKYEGTQFRVEPTISTYFFWMNTTKPPFNDLKVRRAVNYAVDTEALERIYAGQIAGTHQILPPNMPGYKQYNLYPHNMAKAKKLIEEANPSDRNITVWTDSEPENAEAGAYYQGVLRELGFNAKLKEISADNYFTIIGNLSTPDLDTGWSDWFEDYSHPNDFFQPLLATESILPTNNSNFAQFSDPAIDRKISQLGEEPLGSKQEAEYASLDKEVMEEAPWVPYGTRTLSTFVSSAINLEKVIWNPTFEDDLTSFQFR